MKTMFWLDDPNPDWRWACTHCWTEGRGGHPEACPGCGSRHGWYETSAHEGMSMRDAFENLTARIFGAPKQETKH